MLQGITRKGHKGTFWSETFQNLTVLMVAVTKFLSNCTKKLEVFISHKMKVRMLVAQSCLTLHESLDQGQPGSSVHGILQARILVWVASPSPGDLPDSGIEPKSPVLQADSLLTEPPGKPKCWKKNNFLQLLKHLPITLLCDKLQTSKKAVEVYTLQSNCPCLPKSSESKINGI